MSRNYGWLDSQRNTWMDSWIDKWLASVRAQQLFRPAEGKGKNSLSLILDPLLMWRKYDNTHVVAIVVALPSCGFCNASLKCNKWFGKMLFSSASQELDSPDHWRTQFLGNSLPHFPLSFLSLAQFYNSCVSPLSLSYLSLSRLRDFFLSNSREYKIIF